LKPELEIGKRAEALPECELSLALGFGFLRRFQPGFVITGEIEGDPRLTAA
jgi:hypothetical protein